MDFHRGGEASGGDLNLATTLDLPDVGAQFYKVLFGLQESDPKKFNLQSVQEKKKPNLQESSKSF